jgi:hypothetical protein
VAPDQIEISGGSTYIIDTSHSYLKNVSPKTDLPTLLGNIEFGGGNTIKIINKNGIEFTSGYVGTGCKIILYNSKNEVIDLLTVVVKGDISGDGKVDSADISMMLTHIGSNYLTGAYYLAANLHEGSELINSADISMLLNLITIS